MGSHYHLVSVRVSEGNHPVRASVSLPVKWRHTFRVSQLSARHAAGTQGTGLLTGLLLLHTAGGSTSWWSTRVLEVLV